MPETSPAPTPEERMTPAQKDASKALEGAYLLVGRGGTKTKTEIETHPLLVAVADEARKARQEEKESGLWMLSGEASPPPEPNLSGNPVPEIPRDQLARLIKGEELHVAPNGEIIAPERNPEITADGEIIEGHVIVEVPQGSRMIGALTQLIHQEKVQGTVLGLTDDEFGKRKTEATQREDHRVIILGTSLISHGEKLRIDDDPWKSRFQRDHDEEHYLMVLPTGEIRVVTHIVAHTKDSAYANNSVDDASEADPIGNQFLKLVRNSLDHDRAVAYIQTGGRGRKEKSPQSGWFPQQGGVLLPYNPAVRFDRNHEPVYESRPLRLPQSGDVVISKYRTLSVDSDPEPDLVAELFAANIPDQQARGSFLNQYQPELLPHEVGARADEEIRTLFTEIDHLIREHPIVPLSVSEIARQVDVATADTVRAELRRLITRMDNIHVRQVEFPHRDHDETMRTRVPWRTIGTGDDRVVIMTTPIVREAKSRMGSKIEEREVAYQVISPDGMFELRYIGDYGGMTPEQISQAIASDKMPAGYEEVRDFYNQSILYRADNLHDIITTISAGYAFSRSSFDPSKGLVIYSTESLPHPNQDKLKVKVTHRPYETVSDVPLKISGSTEARYGGHLEISAAGSDAVETIKDQLRPQIERDYPRQREYPARVKKT